MDGWNTYDCFHFGLRPIFRGKMAVRSREPMLVVIPSWPRWVIWVLKVWVFCWRRNHVWVPYPWRATTLVPWSNGNLECHGGKDFFLGGDRWDLVIFVGDSKSRFMTNLHQLRRNSLRFLMSISNLHTFFAPSFVQWTCQKSRFDKNPCVLHDLGPSRGDEGPCGVGPKGEDLIGKNPWDVGFGVSKKTTCFGSAPFGGVSPLGRVWCFQSFGGDRFLGIIIFITIARVWNRWN